MRTKIYKYIQEHFSEQPKNVDKLIVSAFFRKNNLTVNKNRFLKSYLIKESDIEATKKLKEFIALIEQHFKTIDIEAMIELFEFVISPSDRIITGAVYTPNNVREYIVQNILDNQVELNGHWKGSDIACGCGGFLYTIAKHLKKRINTTYSHIFSKQLFGLDIKSYSINRTKILLSTLALLDGEDEEAFNFNLFVGDALNFNWASRIENFSGFNCITGNPPYVCSRKIEARTKKHLNKYEVCKSGHPDLYIPFFQIGLELLKPDGYLGFITMNSFFKSLNGRALRAYFQTKKHSFKILDFGTLQVFQKRSTYTCICIIQNASSEILEYRRADSLSVLDSIKLKFSGISYANLKSHNGWNLSSADLINKIESVGKPFSERFKTRNGIATLKNEIYIFDPVDENRDYYFLQNGSLYQVEKSICKEIINPNMLTTQSDLKAITQQFIFPYEFINGKAKILSETRLKNEFPFAYKYLKAKREILKGRDKGEGEYPKWFAFGRTQSLELMRFKLFFPHITPHIPNYIINTDENLFFYNGIAVIGSNERELMLLKKLMSSRLFWFYIKSTSKPYSAGYFSLSKNYIKDFGVYDFSKEDIDFLIKEDNPAVLDTFFETKYGITIK